MLAPGTQFTPICLKHETNVKSNVCKNFQANVSIIYVLYLIFMITFLAG